MRAVREGQPNAATLFLLRKAPESQEDEEEREQTGHVSVMGGPGKKLSLGRISGNPNRTRQQLVSMYTVDAVCDKCPVPV